MVKKNSLISDINKTSAQMSQLKLAIRAGIKSDRYSPAKNKRIKLKLKKIRDELFKIQFI